MRLAAHVADSGNDTAKTKGGVGDCESKGREMCIRDRPGAAQSDRKQPEA